MASRTTSSTSSTYCGNAHFQRSATGRDDDRVGVVFAPTLMFDEGLGEGEDSYLRDGERRYRSKDAPFDSVEELRLVRGVNDDLFEFLRDKTSVYGDERVDVNAASADVIGALMFAHSPLAQAAESSICGEDIEGGAADIRGLFVNYGRLVVDYRKARQSQPQSLLSKPFKNSRSFIQTAKDPFTQLDNMLGGMIQQSGIPRDELLATRYGLPILNGVSAYTAIQQAVNWKALQRSVKTGTNLYRLQVRGRVGNMTRRIFAILKVDRPDPRKQRLGSRLAKELKKKTEKVGKSAPGLPTAAAAIIRTLYYREE